MGTSSLRPTRVAMKERTVLSLTALRIQQLRRRKRKGRIIRQQRWIL